jgi:1-pyrroline-5-carboxylate dehydrogenase
MSIAETLTPFKNEPPEDFSRPDTRRAMDSALEQVTRELGATYPLIIDGKRVHAKKTFKSINPSLPSEVVGVVKEADRALADRALAAAVKAFERWRYESQDNRAQVLLKMAEILRRRKFEFSAWMVLEVGKNWREADADVAEAIDFLEYYARQSLIPPPTPTPVASERNANVYLPLGPVIVIPPWNFPLAILAGMTTAAIVTGNTVVLKPSSQSPVIAAKFMELVEEAGVPPGVINFLTGSGGTIGDYLVGDARTRMIAFTGSKAVGLHINALAAQHAKGQRWIKRVIAEMGGKNAVIVDATADVDAAVDGVLASAYGYQGQKCSACSRAYVHESFYDHFVDNLTAKIKGIAIGPARVPENFMGPVISAGAMKGIQRYIEIGKRQGRMLNSALRSTPRAGEGFYVAPTLFDRLPKHSPVVQEEIFGPVLAITKIKSLADGLEQANSTVYGLTGAVYARDRAALDLAREKFFCGNLYLNRKCTGALVGGHPFGGFNLSGTDSKAGGPDYLLLFRQAQAVSERV